MLLPAPATGRPSDRRKTVVRVSKAEALSREVELCLSPPPEVEWSARDVRLAAASNPSLPCRPLNRALAVDLGRAVSNRLPWNRMPQRMQMERSSAWWAPEGQ